MSPRTSEQFDKIRQEKKELIMETALQLFAEQGFHGTSISQIAKKAGISKGLTYNYFNSKKEILDEMITHGFDIIFEDFDLNNDGVLTDEEFIHFIRQNFQLLRDNTEHWRLFFSLLLQPSAAETFSAQYKNRFEPVFKMLFNFVVAHGSTDPEGDLMAISAMIEGAYLYTIVAPEIFPSETMEDKIIQSIFKIINTNNSNTSKP